MHEENSNIDICKNQQLCNRPLQTPTPSQCPIHHATSALDSIEFGISVADEIASMVDGIQAVTELPLDGLTLAKLKKRMVSLSHLALLTVRFADGRSDILGETRGELQGVLDALKASTSEGWISVGPETMPPDEVVVIGWDSTIGKPCAVFFDFDPGVYSWISQFDPTTIYKGEITHWRYCNAPDGVEDDGVAA